MLKLYNSSNSFLNSQCALPISPNPVAINCMAFNHNSTLLVTGASDGMIRLFGKPPHTVYTHTITISVVLFQTCHSRNTCMAGEHMNTRMYSTCSLAPMRPLCTAWGVTSASASGAWTGRGTWLWSTLCIRMLACQRRASWRESIILAYLRAISLHLRMRISLYWPVHLIKPLFIRWLRYLIRVVFTLTLQQKCIFLFPSLNCIRACII